MHHHPRHDAVPACTLPAAAWAPTPTACRRRCSATVWPPGQPTTPTSHGRWWVSAAPAPAVQPEPRAPGRGIVSCGVLESLSRLVPSRTTVLPAHQCANCLHTRPRRHAQRVGGRQLDAGHAPVLAARRALLLQQPRILAADRHLGEGKLLGRGRLQRRLAPPAGACSSAGKPPRSLLPLLSSQSPLASLQLSNQSLGDYLQRNIFEPLGLNGTLYDTTNGAAGVHPSSVNNGGYVSILTAGSGSENGSLTWDSSWATWAPGVSDMSHYPGMAALTMGAGV